MDVFQPASVEVPEWLNRARAIMAPNQVEVVAYHDPCTDGVCSAALFAEHFDHNDVEFVGLHHAAACPFDNFANKNVLMVDFSYKRDVMLALVDHCRTLLVLDHHKTAQQELEKLSFSVFDMERSGAMMAFYYLNGDKCASRRAPPAVVRLVDDADRWVFAYSQTRTFRYGITGHERQFDFEYWRELLDSSENRGEEALRALIDGRGATQRTIIAREVADIVHNAAKRYLRVPASETEAEEVLCVFAVQTSKHISDVGTALFELHGTIACVYSYNAEHGCLSISLRGRPRNLDLGALAARFGGGGHPGAAGFSWTGKLNTLLATE